MSNASTRSPAMNSRGPALIAVSVVTSVAALATCILRYFVQSRLNQTIGWDDYFIGLAMLLGITGVSFTIVEGANIIENSSNPDPGHSTSLSLEYNYLAQPWLNMGATLSKVSMCLLLLRLAGARVRLWRGVLAVLAVFLLLVNLAFTFATLLQCRPLEKIWNPLVVGGTCWSLGTLQGIGYFQGAVDVFSQLFIALFPIVVIQDLEIRGPVRRPFYLFSIMSIIITMLGILRTYHISLIEYQDSFTFEVIATIFAILEQNLNIISANILPISALFTKTIRPLSQTINDAASARNEGGGGGGSAMSNKNDRARDGSRATLHRRHSSVEGGSLIFIEGGAMGSRLSLESRSAPPSVHEIITGGLGEGRGRGGRVEDVWPLGILKTVSVEVVEEDAAQFEAGMDLGEGRGGRASAQEDWDRYLR
ncbi:hypothetical protein F5Y16DRAFT_396162 [Xylariaceae sp. FL0255]|nr:hypothetical protein F5Y16DRAFT_396162 [Xylariaceae sp. FL0255]